jgi:hypothetical protein
LFSKERSPNAGEPRMSDDEWLQIPAPAVCLGLGLEMEDQGDQLESRAVSRWPISLEMSRLALSQLGRW